MTGHGFPGVTDEDRNLASTLTSTVTLIIAGVCGTSWLVGMLSMFFSPPPIFTVVALGGPFVVGSVALLIRSMMRAIYEWRCATSDHPIRRRRMFGKQLDARKYGLVYEEARRTVYVEWAELAQASTYAKKDYPDFIRKPDATAILRTPGREVRRRSRFRRAARWADIHTAVPTVAEIPLGEFAAEAGFAGITVALRIQAPQLAHDVGEALRATSSRPSRGQRLPLLIPFHPVPIAESATTRTSSVTLPGVGEVITEHATQCVVVYGPHIPTVRVDQLGPEDVRLTLDGVSLKVEIGPARYEVRDSYGQLVFTLRGPRDQVWSREMFARRGPGDQYIPLMLSREHDNAMVVYAEEHWIGSPNPHELSACIALATQLGTRTFQPRRFLSSLMTKPRSDWFY